MNRIIHWNCRGLQARYEEVKVLINEENPDCICLQETQLNNHHYKISNLYNTYHHIEIGENRAKGGTCISVKTNITHNRIPIITTLQVVAIEIQTPANNLKSIASIYLPPQHHITETELTEVIEQLPQPTLIVGDFNAHNRLWYSNKTDNRGIMIENIIQEHSLMCLNNNNPTYYRVHDQLTSIIDLALISESRYLTYTWDTLPSLRGSDHYPAILRVTDKQNKENLPKWNFDLANWTKYTEETKITQSIQDFQDIEVAYKHLKETILTAAKESIPMKSTKLNRPPVPWWNKVCNIEKKNTRSAYRRMKKNPSTANINSYKRREAIKKRTYRNARRESWNQYISTLKSKTPTKQVWTKIKKIEGKYSPKPQPILLHNNQTIANPKQVANIFATHYANISSLLNNPNPQNQNFLNRRNRNDNNEQYNSPFTMEELSSAIHSTQDYKSPGEDQIQNIMIKKLHNNAKIYILDLFNKIWIQETIPEEWNNSIIIPILKQGKPNNLPSSYRPIALNSSLCKIMEKMVNNRLTWYLESQHKIPTQQFGFRQNKCTFEPIAQLTTQITNGFLKRQITMAVLYDIEKAFDTINRNKILYNFHEAGIKGHMFMFLKNYINKRSIKVRIGNQYSRPMQTETGTPQGGVLSSICFTITMNTILKELPSDIQCSLYADDLILYYTTKNPDTAARKLQTTTNKIANWSTQQGLRFAHTKTEAIIFEKRKRNRLVIPVELNGHPIQYKDCVKFLGMILDKRLNWSEHIKLLKAKAKRSLNLLKIVSRLQYGPDRTLLLKLYWAVCRSKMDYGAQFYSSAKPNVIKTLNSIHNEALRLSSGAFRSSPVSSLHAETNEPPLDLHREELCLKYYFWLKSLKDNETLNVFDTALDLDYFIDDTLSKPIGIRSRNLKDDLLPEATPIKCKPQQYPPWKMTNINICTQGTSKKNLPNKFIKQIFNSHLYKHHASHYCFTDGSKTNHKVGFAITLPNKSIRYSLPKEASIYTAELAAIENALKEIQTKQQKTWTIFTDSQSAIQSIPKYNNKHPYVMKIQELLYELSQSKEITICKVPSHVGVEGNEKVDQEAKIAAEGAQSYTNEIPHTDLKQSIKTYTKEIWQLRWNNTEAKLKEIKPILAKWPIHTNRKEDVIISRLRIGHTKLTHDYLMTRGRPPEQPMCCGSRLTVKHLLIECNKYHRERVKHKLPRKVEDLLGPNCPVENLMKYLKEIDVLNSI